MKKLSLITLCFIISVFNLMAKDTDSIDKTALLMVHFGTTFDDTRAETIDAINKKAASEFPDMDVFEAYTSRVVIARLAKRGVIKQNPRQALLRLAAEGYTHVFIQSTNIIYGVEATALRQDADFMVPFFKEIKIGTPLLYTIDDCMKVASILSKRYGSAIDKNSGVVLVGHGTSTPANAIYSQMDYIFHAQGNPRFYVSTVEGYPDFDATLSQLKLSKLKNVTLVPFMFVAGDHARNDIDGEWREKLESEKFKVSTIIEGLGQIPEIQDIFIDHIKSGMKERQLSPLERKAAFFKDNL